MQRNILNTDKTTFLIAFNYQTTNGKFIFQEPLELIYILKNYDKNGIKYIKQLDHKDMKFKSISKAKVLKYAAWETEVAEYLKTHYFFK